MKTRIILFAIFGSGVISCGGKKPTETPILENKNTYEKIKSMNWLIGKWEMGNGDTISTETWTLRNDSILSATSMDTKGGKDTLRYEDITIEQRGQDVFYIPVVKDQNGGKLVEFKMETSNTAKTDGQVIKFENLEHDFPQRIMYQLRGDTLFAQISGPIDGHDVVMKFPMVRAK